MMGAQYGKSKGGLLLGTERWDSIEGLAWRLVILGRLRG